jgi:hypothetical protein
MDWVWTVYKPYVTRYLKEAGIEAPTEEVLQATFFEALRESAVTVLVQEPWQNSVRFKGLARYEGVVMLDLLNDPMRYLVEHFGGGKFKLNFHRGWHFIGTQNFKPQGEPTWKDLPAIEF